MIIVCPSCQSRYKFDETKLGERNKAKTKCAKCGTAIEIENPALQAMTLPPGSFPPKAAAPAPARSEADADTDTKRRRPDADPGGGTVTGKDLHKMGLVELPKDFPELALPRRFGKAAECSRLIPCEFAHASLLVSG